MVSGMSALALAEPAVKTRAVLALGSNLGDRKKTIKGATKALNRQKKIKVVSKSSLYETIAVTESGEDENQPKYLNAVVIVETSLSPKELHQATAEVENKYGRVRLARWAPRTLDIDIITYGTELVETKSLIIPHPRAFERAFVLVPWLEIDPEAVIPGRGRISLLLEGLDGIPVMLK